MHISAIPIYNWLSLYTYYSWGAAAEVTFMGTANGACDIIPPKTMATLLKPMHLLKVVYPITIVYCILCLYTLNVRKAMS